MAGIPPLDDKESGAPPYYNPRMLQDCMLPALLTLFPVRNKRLRQLEDRLGDGSIKVLVEAKDMIKACMPDFTEHFPLPPWMKVVDSPSPEP